MCLILIAECHRLGYATPLFLQKRLQAIENKARAVEKEGQESSRACKP
jgi:hypothetical protein